MAFFMSDNQHSDSYQSNLKAYFLSGSFYSLIIQGLLYIITFGTSILLARCLGSEQYGIYSTVLSWISVFSILAVLGYDDLLLKKLPRFSSEVKDGSRFWIGFALRRSLFFSTILVVILYLITQFSSITHFYNTRHVYLFAVLLIPLFAALHILQSSLRAKRHIIVGQMGEKTIQPVFFLLSIIFIVFFFEMNVAQVMIGRVLSFGIAVVFSIYYVAIYIPSSSLYKSDSSEINTSQTSAYYFLFLSLIYILISRCDILVLSLFAVPDQMIAYYNAAAKISEVTLIPFVILYTVSTPVFSELSEQKDRSNLQAFYTKSTRYGFVFVLVLFLGIYLFRSFLLSLFGDDFVQGIPVLLPLIVAKLLHAFVGPINYLMMMIGLERTVTYASLAGLIVTVVLQILFVNQGGTLAVAYATLVGFVVYEVLLCIQLYRKTGLIPTILGQIKS